ncbi:hypothetical protein TEA_005006 [Camellia sinensis var. sinensis]|uniref:Uncharacterized protein n=1 Tax=Camellia sinensis var. sinensis TaxID=542762 RepID=A0A4S4F277_CAMSN|nr:hypothetical protein TEA_005006 [Camellia sinensis var. sinensis]
MNGCNTVIDRSVNCSVRLCCLNRVYSTYCLMLVKLQFAGHHADTHSIKAPLHLAELPNASQNISLVCKRERSDDCPFPCMDNSEPVSLVQNKMSKHNDPNSSQANGSEDSTTTTQDLFVSTTTTTTNCSSALLEFPLFESIEPKENHPNNTLTFDAANLEKSVPPGYLKFISNLETEILNVSMERETLKIEVMRAQAMINILQTRIDLLNKENEDLRRVVPDV